MKNQSKIQFALTALLLLLLLTKTKAQTIHIDSVKVNGQVTTSVQNGGYVTIYLTPPYPTWAQVNPNFQLKFTFFGGATVWATTASGLQDSNFVVTIRLYDPSWTGQVSQLNIKDINNYSVSNSITLFVSFPSGNGSIFGCPAAEIKSVTFYSLNGQRITNPKGLVIKSTEYLSGSFYNVKVVIRGN